MKEDAFDQYVKAATLAADVSIEDVRQLLYPHYDILARTSALSAALCARVQAQSGTHCVMVSFLRNADGEPEYTVWCGDKFIEGRNLPETEARDRALEAAGGATRQRLADELMKAYNTFGKESDRCNFWTVWRRDKKLCEHTSGLLAHLRDNMPDFKNQLAQAYDAAAGGAQAPVPAGDTFELDELAFRVPVLFEGERGAGKTVTAREFARRNGYAKVEMGGHEGLESPDLLGYLVPYGNGQMVWKDGPLSEAFRLARQQKVVLVIDELLRVPTRELSVLLTALSPDRGVYRLRTGRIVEVSDGVGREEELEAPVENLCIVATTNVGAEYAVDDIDPALAERFVVMRKDTTEAELRRILSEVAAQRKLPKSVVNECVQFFKKMTEARAMGLVRHAPTTRTLCRALELSSGAADVKRGIKSQVLLWVARTAEGHPVPEQLKDVEKIIDKCFK